MGNDMDIVNVEIFLLFIIVALSYFLPAFVWLMYRIDSLKMEKISSVQEFINNAWFNRKNKIVDLNGIRNKLIKKEQSAKKRLRILFAIVMPAICFLVNIILIKQVGRYYIKKKFDFDLPPTSIISYISTLVLLSAWTSGVLLNKLLIWRINKLLRKADGLAGQHVSLERSM
jgi:hypothetical protein